jgi:hypothetical protein
MRDSLSCRIAGKNDEELSAAFETAHYWIERNANGPLKLNLSLALRLSPVDDDAMLADLSRTDALFDEGTTPAFTGRVSCGCAITAGRLTCKIQRKSFGGIADETSGSPSTHRSDLRQGVPRLCTVYSSPTVAASLFCDQKNP